MHLLSLINQILDVAKVEAGRMELELETVPLDVLVNETLAMLESTAEAKGIALRRELPSDMAPLVTDAGQAAADPHQPRRKRHQVHGERARCACGSPPIPATRPAAVDHR